MRQKLTSIFFLHCLKTRSMMTHPVNHEYKIIIIIIKSTLGKLNQPTEAMTFLCMQDKLSIFMNTDVFIVQVWNQKNITSRTNQVAWKKYKIFYFHDINLTFTISEWFGQLSKIRSKEVKHVEQHQNNHQITNKKP